VDEYWNHNTAYHRWLRNIAARRGGDVLDVGCGDGLLVGRLAGVARHVTGIDIDDDSVQRARRRIAGIPDAEVQCRDFATLAAEARRFDLITFVASIHHVPLRQALIDARSLLTAGGELAVVGLSANKRPADWAWAVLTTPVAMVGSRLHRETPDIGVPVRDPSDSLAEIRTVARDVLPGNVIRRGVYYRYRLWWRNG